MKKLLVSDYDKTLYLNDLDMKQNIILLDKFIKKGNIFVVSTGRSLETFKDKIEKYNIPLNYIILNHGSVIMDNKYKIIQYTLIEKKDLKDLLEYINNKFVPLNILVYGKLKISKKLTKDITKITLLFSTRSEAEIVLKDLKENFSNKFNIYLINSNSNRIEIISNKTNKSISIKKIIELENLSKDNVYTIGDSSTDIEMIKDYSGCAMKNSEELVYKYTTKLYESVSQLIADIT